MSEATNWRLYAPPYTHTGSKVEYLLGIKDLAYRSRIVPLSHIPLVTRELGVEELPVLEVDDECIPWERAAQRIEQEAPEPGLYPEEPRARRLCLALEDWADLDLAHRTQRVTHAYLKDEPDELSEAFGGGVRGYLVGLAANRWSLLNEGVTSTVARQDAAFMEAALAHLDGLLADHGNLVSADLTAADVAVVALLDPLLRFDGLRARFDQGHVLDWAATLNDKLREQAASVRIEMESG